MHLKNMLKATTRFFLFLLMLVLALVSYYYVFPFTNTDHHLINAENENEKVRFKRLQGFAAKANSFCKTKGYNIEVCLLIDMSLPSGKNRFFEFDMKNDSIISTGLVAHGSCNKNFLANPKFSNETGCGCTALGKYKVGYKYKGRFGNAYKLYGLDSSNSNAFKRNIVLHSYYMVPDKETFPAYM
jgi:L,D-transpeptidase catalytic domain